MKIPVIKRVKIDMDFDVASIAENLIYHNIDGIIDNLMDEFMDDPEFYMNESVEMDEDIHSTLNQYIREELSKNFVNYAEIR